MEIPNNPKEEILQLKYELREEQLAFIFLVNLPPPSTNWCFLVLVQE